MPATRRAPPAVPQSAPDVLDTPAAVAHVIRDRVTALSNILETLRLTAGDNPALAAGLSLAARQVEALARVADAVHDPARGAPAN